MASYGCGMRIDRRAALTHRIRTQGLAQEGVDDCPVLDLGVQDTGPDGAAWALEIRGHVPTPGSTLLAWTVRGAPHLYRRAEIADVAAATAPFSEADARKRVFDAAKPLVAAGIEVIGALDAIAGQMREIVTEDTVKGELSAQLSERLPEPYLRFCHPCQATHTYEQPFRLAALRAGLELVPATSPPVLRRIEGWSGPAEAVPKHLDQVRALLHLVGPTTPQLVAGYLDAPVTEVRKRWPSDAVEIELEGERRWALDADLASLTDQEGTVAPDAVRLLGPFDLHLQARDRDLLVADPVARKDLWRTLGRPGAVLAGTEIVGSWRPRSAGRKLSVRVNLWDGSDPDDAIVDQAERLAQWRGKEFAGVLAG